MYNIIIATRKYMLKLILEKLKKFFLEDSWSHNLEAYIIAGNPQDIHDVDRLEREFYEKRKLNILNRYY